MLQYYHASRHFPVRADFAVKVGLMLTLTVERDDNDREAATPADLTVLVVVEPARRDGISLSEEDLLASKEVGPLFATREVGATVRITLLAGMPPVPLLSGRRRDAD